MITNVRHFSDTTWCLLIAVNHYQDSRLNDLRSPANDVHLLKKELCDGNNCALPPEQVIIEEGKNGVLTVPDIVAAFALIQPKITTDSLVIVYFAGHGISNQQDFSLCVSTTNIDNLSGTSLTGQQLGDILSGFPIRGLLMILDCCQGAGFAAHAPNYFRELKDNDFRILLSSTKAHELAWERDGKTLFCQFLMDAIRGKDAIGENKGLIHFSELLQYLHDRFEEAYQSGDYAGQVQTPVFAGVYPKDPLIFVNREITLDQIKVKTTRYTRAYVRKQIRGVIITIAVILGLVTGGWYVLLDKTQYVEPRNGFLAIYKGYPGLNALDFPKLLWETALPESAVKTRENKTAAILSAIGRPVFPVLKTQLTPTFYALALTWQDSIEKARLGLWDYFKKDESEFYDDAALQLFSTIPVRQDTAIFDNFIKSPRPDLRYGGMMGLLRTDPVKLEQYLMNSKDLNSKDVHRYILDHIQTVTDPSVALRMIRTIIRTKTYTDDNGHIFAALVSNGLKLSATEIGQLVNSSFSGATDNAVMYARYTHQESAVASVLVDSIRMAGPQAYISGVMLDALSKLHFDYSRINVQPFLNSTSFYNREAAILFSVSKKTIPAEKIPAEFDRDYNLYIRLGPTGTLNGRVLTNFLARLDYDHLDIGQLKLFLDANRKLFDQSAIPFLQKMLRYNDPNDIPTDLYQSALAALRELNYPVNVTASFLNSPSQEVRTIAYDWLYSSKPETVIQQMLSVLGDPNGSFAVNILNNIPLSSATLDKLMSVAKSSNVEATGNAAIVVAVQGSGEQVTALLNSPNRAIRENVLAHVAANAGFQAISVKFKPAFPGNEQTSLKEQAAVVRKIEVLTAGTDEQVKDWIVSILTGWENESPGIRERFISGYLFHNYAK